MVYTNVMHQEHPNYTREPLKEDLAREHFLHRLVAGSAFLFALCILPVAQYFLVGTHTTELGQVEGISIQVSPSPSATVFASENGATLAECVAKKDTDTSDLTRFLDGKKKAMLKEYEQTVQPYNTAIAQVRLLPPSEQNTQSIAAYQKLIDNAATSYNQDLTNVNNAVAAEEQSIQNRTCPAQ